MVVKMIGVAVGPKGLCASPSQSRLNSYVALFCSTMVFQVPELSVQPVL
jgi:hypothetical protein